MDTFLLGVLFCVIEKTGLKTWAEGGGTAVEIGDGRRIEVGGHLGIETGIRTV